MLLKIQITIQMDFLIKKTFWTKGNIYADVVGGAQSALWGGAAGHLGAVMVGVSEAFYWFRK